MRSTYEACPHKSCHELVGTVSIRLWSVYVDKVLLSAGALCSEASRIEDI